MERLLACIGACTVLYGVGKLFNLLVNVRVANELRHPHRTYRTSP